MMTQPSFYTDEDVYGSISIQLKRAGVDAISTPEAGNLTLSDEQQLAWSAKNNRVIITFNTSDFCRLHLEWLSNDRHHSGIVVSARCSIGFAIKRILRLTRSLSAEEMVDRLEFLGNWTG